jgi:predicted lipoprotein with Yx(FWY)xxD motif
MLPACHALVGRPGPVHGQLVNPWRALAVVTVMSADMTNTNSRLQPSWRLLLRVIGAGLLIATASIHLDLYLTGYNTIPTIGPLFLLQVIVGYAAALAVLATGSRLAAAFGAVFALSTLGGYLLTVQFGLFGFREVRTTAGIVAGVLEVAAFVALAVIAATPAGSTRLGSRAAQNRWASLAANGVSGVVAVVGALAVAVVAFGLLGGALAGAGTNAGSSQSGSAAAGGELRTTTIGGVTVLTNAAGKTLYSFAPDTSTKSACYGSCAVYWPPVSGPVKAGPGVTGTLGTIARTGGGRQATYNGHPLYTYVGDSGPGQAHGNNLNLNGGLWHEVVVTG